MRRSAENAGGHDELRQPHRTPPAHETRRAAPDLSDEGIDHTLVWFGGTRYQSLIDEGALGGHPS